MPCIYIKKVLCQKLKLKNNTTFFKLFIALDVILAQVDIYSVKNHAESCFDIFCSDSSTTAEDKIKRIKTFYNK